MIEWRSSYNNDPLEDGYYATQYCWDALEGGFCAVVRFLGGMWEENLPLLQWAGPFATEEQADVWLEEHDISF